MADNALVLLDFDGTLVDSKDYLNTALQTVSGLDHDGIVSTFGEETEHRLGALGVAPPDVIRISTDFTKYIVEDGYRGVEFFPGVDSWLRDYQAEWEMCVVTRSPAAAVEAFLRRRHINLPVFQAVGQRRSKAKIFREIAAKHPLVSRIVIGDGPEELLAGGYIEALRVLCKSECSGDDLERFGHADQVVERITAFPRDSQRARRGQHADLVGEACSALRWQVAERYLEALWALKRAHGRLLLAANGGLLAAVLHFRADLLKAGLESVVVGGEVISASAAANDYGISILEIGAAKASDITSEVWLLSTSGVSENLLELEALSRSLNFAVRWPIRDLTLAADHQAKWWYPQLWEDVVNIFLHEIALELGRRNKWHVSGL